MNYSESPNISKITLGTAQLGMDYGIANKFGEPKISNSVDVLSKAIDLGITSFDTARVYGESERILGDFFKKNNLVDQVNVITKISQIKLTKEISVDSIYEFLKEQILLSLNQLKLNQIPMCLLHNVEDLNSYGDLIVDAMSLLKKNGYVKKIGISSYLPDDVKNFLNYDQLDVIQIPVNIFDLRLIKSNLLKELQEKNTIIFARSIFLQGLFFIEHDDIPPYLINAKNYLKELDELTNHYKISINELALLFVRDLKEISSLVLGIDTSKQLEENMLILKKPPLSNKIIDNIFNKFSNVPENVINPSLWK